MSSKTLDWLIGQEECFPMWYSCYQRLRVLTVACLPPHSQKVGRWHWTAEREKGKILSLRIAFVARRSCRLLHFEPNARTVQRRLALSEVQLVTEKWIFQKFVRTIWEDEPMPFRSESLKLTISCLHCRAFLEFLVRG